MRPGRSPIHTSLMAATEPPGEAESTRAEPLLGWGAHAWRGRFTILERHARGGLGQVSLARDEDLGRQVALKEIRPEFVHSNYARERFLQEAEITAQLEHPGIVPIHAVGQGPHGQPFYAMRFVRGRSFLDAIREFHDGTAALELAEAEQHTQTHDGELGRPPAAAASSPRRVVTKSFRTLEFRDLLRRFVDVCHAIAFAHSQGVIHRDLKPTNVMLGEYGETIVLDWGLAKRAGAAESEGIPPLTEQPDEGVSGETALQPGLTRPGEIMGTPAYMAPEQAAGDQERIGPATDIYALGVLLYQILTSQPPCAAESREELLAAVRRGEIQPPSAKRSAVPRPLEAVCLKALALRPEDRYASATELARDVERWLADEPVSAHQEPLYVRAARWARRHRPLVAGAFALLLTALAALTVGFFVVKSERDEKEDARRLALTHLAQARTQRTRAEGHYERSLQAIDRMLSRTGESTLRSVPHMDQTRRQLLQDALELYSQILAEEPEPEPKLKLQFMQAYMRRGLIHTDLAQYREAERDLLQGLEIAAELEREGTDPDKITAYRTRLTLFLANCHHHAGRPQEAEQHYRKGIDLALPFLRGSVVSSDVRIDWLTANMVLGGLLSEQRRYAEAEVVLTTARDEVLRALLQEPQHPKYRSLSGQIHLNLGETFRLRGRLDEAESAFKTCIAQMQESGLDPTFRSMHRSERAYALGNLGLLYMSRGKLTEAEATIREAIRALEEVVRAHPAIPLYRANLSKAYLNLAAVYGRQLRLADAAAAAQKAAVLWPYASAVPDLPRP
jgi:serine/threonine-protein kinase